MQIVPLRFLSYIYIQKEAFRGLQNAPKSVFGRSSAPNPAGGAPDAPSNPLVVWRGDTPHHTPPHSAPTLRRSPCVPFRIAAWSTPMLMWNMLFFTPLIILSYFVANFIRVPAVQKNWKSVKIWQSHREFKGGNFFETQCTLLQQR